MVYHALPGTFFPQRIDLFLLKKQLSIIHMIAVNSPAVQTTPVPDNVREPNNISFVSSPKNGYFKMSKVRE